MTKIMLVEDDTNLGLSLQKLLNNESYHVDLAKTLEDANRLLSQEHKIIILDWMLPDGQGIDFLKGLRQKGNMIPVIMLTARIELIDKILGLETGANDYLTKPFEPRELVARIRVQLRSANQGAAKISTNKIERGEITIIASSREVIYKAEKIELTKMEFDLLKLLSESPGRVFSREEILNKVWGYENFPTTRTVDTHVLQLRQKISEDYIETIRGIGYRFTVQ